MQFINKNIRDKKIKKKVLDIATSVQKNQP
jgi:hypothetical protein